MRIFRHCTELPPEAKGGVIVLGNFDGVHKGHQSVIAEGLKLARMDHLSCGVMTFEPHPRAFFAAGAAPFRLTPLRIKAHILEHLGVDHLLVQHFDQTLAEMAAEDFVTSILAQCLKVAHVVIGHDYVFGRGRKGHVEMLLDMGDWLGFRVTQVPAVTDPNGDIYSSTAVRECLLSGRVAAAAEMLGRYWELEGRVEGGDKRGRDIGFPTANVHLGDYQRPATGVYAVKAGIDLGTRTEWFDGVANFGTRPTFDGGNAVLEVHLFDFDGDLYHRHLRVALIDYIRAERKFAGIAELKAQIGKDAARARAILADLKLPDDTGPLVPTPVGDRASDEN